LKGMETVARQVQILWLGRGVEQVENATNPTFVRHRQF